MPSADADGNPGTGKGPPGPPHCTIQPIQGITWAEVASVLEFRKGDHIAVLYRPFIDDCWDQKQEEIVTVGAVIASHGNWGPIRKKWNTRLHRAGLNYFRSTEYYSLRGQFDIFRDPEKYPKPKGSEAAKALRDDLEAILRDSSAVVGIGVAIPLRLYHWFRDTVPGAKDKFGGDAYYSALQTLMIECACIVRDELSLDRKGRPNRLAFVCDDTDRAPIYAAAYAGFRTNNPALSDVIGGLVHLDDKTHPPVQAADMMASVTKEVALPLISEMDTVPLPSRSEPPRLKGIAYRISVLDYNWMMKLLAAQTFGEEYASLLSRHRQT